MAAEPQREAHVDPAATNGHLEPDYADDAGPEADPTTLLLLQLCFDESELAAPAEGGLDASALSPLGSPSTPTDDAPSSSNEDFDAVGFVAGKLRHVPLQTLKHDLERYTAHLQANVLKAVQDDVYEAFVDASGQLSGLSQNLRKAHMPLAAISEKVGVAKTTLHDATAEVEALVTEATRHEQARCFDSTLLEVTLLQRHVKQCIEAIKEHDAKAKEKRKPKRLGSGRKVLDLGYEEEPPGLDHVAGLAQRACELAAQLPPMAVDDRGREEAAAAGAVSTSLSTTVIEMTDEAFIEAYGALADSPSGDSAQRIGDVTAVYRMLHAEDRCASVMKEQIVRPAVEKVLTWQAVTQARSAKAQDASSKTPLTDLFDSLSQELTRGVLTTLPLLNDKLFAGCDMQESARRSLLVQSVWPAVFEGVAKRMSWLTAPGIANEFHRHFVAANRVVSLLEQHCATAEELLELRSSRDMVAWVRRWNLDVYHTLRQGELQAKVDEMLDAGWAAAGDGHFTLPPFQRAMAVASWALRPDDVFLYPLQHKFFRDCCGVFTSLVQAAEAHATKADALTIISVVKETQKLAAAAEVQLPTLILKALGATAPTAAPNASDSNSAPNSHSLQQETFTMATALAGFVAQELRAGASRMQRGIVERLTAEVMVSVGNLKSIKALFSMTRKPMPTAPSMFLQGAFDPLQRFRDAATSTGALSDEESRKMLRDVVHAVLQGAHVLTRDLLVAARKAQESLEKLRRKKQPAGEAPAKPTLDTATDRDKMVVQLYLDAQEMGGMVRPFGVQKESDPVFAKFLKLTRRAVWILGGFEGTEPEEVEDHE